MPKPALLGYACSWLVARGRWLVANWRALAWTLAGVLILLAIVAFALSWLTNPIDPWTEMWLETLSGNWSPEQFRQATGSQARTLGFGGRLEFSFFAAFAMLLNNATIFLVAGLFWQWSKDRRDRMALNLIHALAMRDLKFETAVKNDLNEMIPEDKRPKAKAAIARAFARARESWEHKTLDEVFGSKRARLIREKLGTINLDA